MARIAVVCVVPDVNESVSVVRTKARAGDAVVSKVDLVNAGSNPKSSSQSRK